MSRFEILEVTFLVSLIVVTLCWWWGVTRGNNNISLIDGYYGCASFVHVVLTYALWDDRTTQGLLVTIVVGLWSIGLGQALGRRWWAERAHGGDQRYRAAAASLGMGDGATEDRGYKWKSYALAAPQAILIAILNLPIQLAIMTHDDLKPIGVIGLIVIAVGGTIEVVANRQLEVFRKAGHPSGSTLMTGLWSWSRHPNYFGNTTVYVGAFLVAVSDPGLWWTAVSPLVILYTLRWGILGTGVHGMDKFMLEKRAGNQVYLDYVRRTSAFVPRPPRRMVQTTSKGA